MEPTTLRLPAELAKNLSQEAAERGYSSRSEYIRQILRHRNDTGATTQRIGSDTEPNTSVDELVGRIDALEERLDALEQAHTSESAERDSEPVESHTSVPSDEIGTAESAVSSDSGDDVIDEALAGWTHGRSREERQASDELARAATEWLRDAPHNSVQRADVPLEELAGDDPVGRTADTIWSEIIRNAWQHAADRGFVEQPHSRAYRWVGRP